MTAPMFDVTPASAHQVVLDHLRRATFAFTVSSRSDTRERAIVQAEPLSNRDLERDSETILQLLDPSWLTITEPTDTSGADRRRPVASFKARETRQIAVKVEVSKTAPMGVYRFRLRVAPEVDPAARSCESAPVSFVVPSQTQKDGPSSPRFARLLVALVIVIGVVTALVVLKRDDPPGSSAPEVTGGTKVPDVVGLDHVHAVEVLRKSHLTPMCARFAISDQSEGQVLGQMPSPGSQAENDEVVALDIAGRAVDVPDLMNKSIIDAKATLSAKGLGWTIGGQQMTGGVASGTVVSQDPKLGARVEPEHVVGLHIEGEGVNVPALEGDSLVQAMIKLQEANLQIGDVTKKPDAAKPSLIVAAQAPEPNHRLAAGTRVDLEVWVGLVPRAQIKFSDGDIELLKKAGLWQTAMDIQRGTHR